MDIAKVTWNGTNLQPAKATSGCKRKSRKQTPYQYRYYLNYCTFNYSMSWWDWDRWQKEIDWMALHGINMPLAVTGEEYTWYSVYKDLGFSDDDLKDFFCGPPISRGSGWATWMAGAGHYRSVGCKVIRNCSKKFCGMKENLA
jgi:hypothetical protein